MTYHVGEACDHDVGCAIMENPGILVALATMMSRKYVTRRYGNALFNDALWFLIFFLYGF